MISIHTKIRRLLFPSELNKNGKAEPGLMASETGASSSTEFTRQQISRGIPDTRATMTEYKKSNEQTTS
jgi:hypothetical protein